MDEEARMKPKKRLRCAFRSQTCGKPFCGLWLCLIGAARRCETCKDWKPWEPKRTVARRKKARP